jgi:UDP-glucose 4-epimerase
MVTGGGGFIGAAVVNELKRRGHSVFVYDRPDDIRDASRLNACIDGCNAVIHLAGLLGTHELFDSQHEAVAVNIGGTLNVLDACVAAEASYVGITMPPVFPSIYTATKKGAAALEDAYRHNYGLNVARVRAFNAFGPGQKYGAGHPQKIVPTFAMRAWAGEPIPIWGDGDQTVDLIHTDELARILVDAIGCDGLTIDGGTGYGPTVNDVAQFVLAVTKSKAGIEYLPMRRGEIPTQIKAEGEGWDRLDWKPRFSWRQLADTVLWYGRKSRLEVMLGQNIDDAVAAMEHA